jgi:hypothetical protein
MGLPLWKEQAIKLEMAFEKTSSAASTQLHHIAEVAESWQHEFFNLFARFKGGGEGQGVPQPSLLSRLGSVFSKKPEGPVASHPTLGASAADIESDEEGAAPLIACGAHDESVLSVSPGASKIRRPPSPSRTRDRKGVMPFPSAGFLLPGALSSGLYVCHVQTQL